MKRCEIKSRNIQNFVDKVKEKNEKIEKKIVQTRKIPSTVKGTGHKGLTLN